jgi:transposase
MISPHRANRRKPKTQGGRKLRRYKRRWKVERLIGWLHNYRRVLVRYERHTCNFLGLVKLACACILLRAFMR